MFYDDQKLISATKCQLTFFLIGSHASSLRWNIQDRMARAYSYCWRDN